MKRILALILTLLMMLALTGCKPKEPEEKPPNPVATITLEDGGMMRFELYPDLAPNTVNNFIKLANGGYYDGLEIFRVVSNVLIQTGDASNNGTGDPGYYIAGEFNRNGYSRNTLSHMRGTISMARKSDNDTAGSQFFIMQGSYPEYDGSYAAFGRITDDASLNVLDEIGARPVDGNYKPLDRIRIQSVRVSTFDVEYPDPDKLDKKTIDARKEKEKEAKKSAFAPFAAALAEASDTPIDTIQEEDTNMSNPIVTIEMENGGIIKAELYPEIAPNTVANFVTLVSQGFYDGVIFHRVIPGFMIQGGDPQGTGMGGPGYTIAGEFARNGFKQNNLKHTRGVLSMARTMMPNSAGSQFFIMHANAPHLDGEYAGFGKVIEGMDVVDAIATTRTGMQDRPVQEQRIKKATVETFGVTYEVKKYGK